jgi:chemotaxis protein MotB
MLRRNREETNAWPGFVDLFSNLVIILLFLLIIFVVLSSAGGMFKTNARAAAEIAELQKKAADSDALIAKLSADKNAANVELQKTSEDVNDLIKQKAILAEQVARQMFESEEIASRNAAEKLQNAEEQARMQQQLAEMDAARAQTENEKTRLLAELDNLHGTLRAEELKSKDAEISAQKIAELSAEISRLNSALIASEQKSAENEYQYIELSNRFNRALADKLAEMGDMREYQSIFFSAIKKALGDTTAIKMEDDKFTLPADILFASGSAKISDAGLTQLHQISNVIKEIYEKIPKNVAWIIRVDGHTDKTPVRAGASKFKDNTELSLMRARAVVDVLTSDGIDPKLLIPTGFGEMYPIALGNLPEDLQKNRRIELRLTNP